MSAERGSSIYAAYVNEQLAAQDSRKSSIEQRGIAVITTSGTLVSLLFGLVAVLTAADDYQLPGEAKPWLYVALVAFVVAAIAGIVTNAPLFYAGVKTADLEMAVKSLWSDSPTDAERRITATNVKLLATAKKRNTFKGFVLVGAISFQLVAVAALALAIRVVMSSG